MATPEQQQPTTANGDREKAAGVSVRTGREESAREGARAMRSLASHFSDLTREVSTLVRDETALARAEITEDIAQIKKGGGSLVIGGTLALAGVLLLVGSAAAALALVWPLWLAALVVGAAALIIGGIAALLARKMTQQVKLDRTMESGRSISRTAREAVRP